MMANKSITEKYSAAGSQVNIFCFFVLFVVCDAFFLQREYHDTALLVRHSFSPISFKIVPLARNNARTIVLATFCNCAGACLRDVKALFLFNKCVCLLILFYLFALPIVSVVSFHMESQFFTEAATAIKAAQLHGISQLVCVFMRVCVLCVSMYFVNVFEIARKHGVRVHVCDGRCESDRRIASVADRKRRHGRCQLGALYFFFVVLFCFVLFCFFCLLYVYCFDRT